MKYLKSYEELSKLKTFEERYEYLKNSKLIGAETFGKNRYLNQAFYKSRKWKDARRKAIIRDNGNDLGVDGFPLSSNNIIVHHINSIAEEDILNDSECLYDLNNLITTSRDISHNAIEYGSDNLIKEKTSYLVERYPNDQAPWK